jgi:hypothetical protein
VRFQQERAFHPALDIRAGWLEALAAQHGA